MRHHTYSKNLARSRSTRGSTADLWSIVIIRIPQGICHRAFLKFNIGHIGIDLPYSLNVMSCLDEAKGDGGNTGCVTRLEGGCINEIEAIRSLGFETEGLIFRNKIPECCCPEIQGCSGRNSQCGIDLHVIQTLVVVCVQV